MKAYFTILLFLLIDLLNFSLAQIESIGPYGGYIECMTKDKNENVLAGTLYGGIYFTSDLGENWTQIFYGHRNLDVRSLAVSPENIYFAGTDAGGLFRSTDLGTTWEKTNNLFNTETIITIVALENNVVLVGTFDGLFKSTDNGKTFSSSSDGITTNSISCLAYSGTFLLAGTAYNGIFISIDTAKTWQPTNDGIDYTNKTVESITFSENSGKSLNKSNAALQDTSKTVVASLGDRIFQAQFVSSLGDDIFWGKKPPPPMYIKVTNIRADNSIVGACPSKITTAGGGIVILHDKDTAWVKANVPDFPFSSIVTTSKRTIAGTYGRGTYAADNNTPNFELRYNEMFGTSISKIAVGDNGIIAATDGGLYKTTDEKFWEDFTKNLIDDAGAQFLDVVINKLTGTTFTTNSYGTYRLPQDGTEWLNMNYIARTLGVNDEGTVFFGNGANIAFSNDDGVTINKTFISDIPNVNNFTFRHDTVYISTADPSGNVGNGVWISTPPSYTDWKLDGLAGEPVTYVVSIDDSWSSLDCFKDIVLVAAANNKIYFRDKNGQYTEHSDGLNPDGKITSILPYPRFYNPNEQTNLLVARIPTVSNLLYPFVTSSKFDFDNCQWKDDLAPDYTVRTIASESLNHRNTFLKGEQSGQYVLYGTLGTGILRRDLTTDVKNKDVTIPSEFSLKQNYPNPFNPSTNIQFDLPNESFTKLEIFNALGEKVATLISEILPAGTHKYEWNAKELASGVYFYRLTIHPDKIEAGNFLITKKLIIIK